jgi:ADP-ribosylglycohydrolase
MKDLDKFLGCMYGLAIGDAIGFPVEFMNLGQIKEKFGEQGVTGFEHAWNFPKGTYSDDTQMSIAVANGILSAGNANDLESVMKNIGQEFIKWYNSPENNRAPGETCAIGCENLQKGMHWRESGVNESKGCGAAMRTAPIGLFYSDIEKVKEVAYASSVCTHAHPTGVASGVATACLVHLALHRCRPESMLDKLFLHTDKYDVYREFRRAIEEVNDVLSLEPEKAIPEIGQGWIGEEAVGIALYSFLKSPDDYRKTVLTAANITGDSDSTACIAGAISGAYNGIANLPEKWVREIENSELLKEIAEQLYRKRL